MFTTRVGVGQSHWPTPRGDFYTREMLSGYNMPVYGPIAIGLSARSPVLTDWPGGGFIGHSRDEPAGDPARARLARLRPHEQLVRSCVSNRLMPLGTPVQVRS